MSWAAGDAAVVPNGRRAYKGAATWLLGFPHPPPEVVISMTFDNVELARMQLTEFTRQPKQKEANVPSNAPSTWAEVAKRTLEVTRPRPSDQQPPAFNWNDQDSVQMSQDDQSEVDEEEEEEQRH
eukprot:6262368-Amphidinium_carterae.2